MGTIERRRPRCSTPRPPAIHRIAAAPAQRTFGELVFKMMNPQKFQDEISHIVLHAWIATYLGARTIGGPTSLSSNLQAQTTRLQESAAQLAIALEKMRAANAKLAARMAEHRAFFAKYQTPG
jgi:hypothetical protein